MHSDDAKSGGNRLGGLLSISKLTASSRVGGWQRDAPQTLTGARARPTTQACRECLKKPHRTPQDAVACTGHVLGGSQRGSWCVRSVGTTESSQMDESTFSGPSAQKMFGAGVVFEAIVVLAVNIRSDGTWDVVRLTSPSVGGSGAACGQSPEVKPAKKPGVTGAKGSSGAISGPP